MSSYLFPVTFLSAEAWQLYLLFKNGEGVETHRFDVLPPTLEQIQAEINAVPVTPLNGTFVGRLPNLLAF